MTRYRRPIARPRGLRAPTGYSRVYERDMTLTDGRVVRLRPVVPDDVEELRRAVAEADAETLHSRFLGGRPPETDEEFERLVRVDYDRRFAVVALTQSRRGVGIARYEAGPDGDAAEVAVAVDPGWRRVGLASAMLMLLGQAALDHAITRFTMEFMVENVDVSSIMSATHLPVVVHQSHGVAEAEVDLSAAEQELGLSLPSPRR